MNFIAIIPARFASMRLPGKPLIDINGKPMVIHVMGHAIQSGADRVIVATDHSDVAAAVSAEGGEVCLTRLDHKSGTERLAEVIEKFQFTDNTIIVNVQSDEPLIQPEIIRQVVSNLTNCIANITTLAVPISSTEEAFDPNTVKVVRDTQDCALYFSRAPIPWNRKGFSQINEIINGNLLRHIGIYAYRAGFIRRYISWGASQLEEIESLEQLRVLWNGEKIHVDVAHIIPMPGVNTLEDLGRVRAILVS